MQRARRPISFFRFGDRGLAISATGNPYSAAASKKKVVIVGAGTAGLSLASKLSRQAKRDNLGTYVVMSRYQIPSSTDYNLSFCGNKQTNKKERENNKEF
jgi:malic enzyme